MTKREEVAKDHQQRLISGFVLCLDEYDRRNPFDRQGQLSGHVRTIQLRREAASAAAALEDGRFRATLYETLGAWGIGRRGSALVSRSDFNRALLAHRDGIVALDNLFLGSAEAALAEDRLWSIIADLGIVQNEASLVAHTKALHHILPDLVVPMDRAYTRPFLGWQGPQFQYQQERVFRDGFRRFSIIANEVQPEKYVAKGWRSSRTKVIDNAIVGFVLTEAATTS